jgi:hypothetical protein
MMNIHIAEKDAVLVDAAKEIGRSAAQISELVESSQSSEKATAAIEAANTMFQSNIQCLSHILSLRKESEEAESTHIEMVEQLKEDFSKEVMTHGLVIESKDNKIAALEKSLQQKDDELSELRSGQALQGVWASLLSPDSFPLPGVVDDESGVQQLSLRSSVSLGPGVNVQKSGIAAALRMISAQIAKDVITQAAVDQDGNKLKNRSEGFVSKILEAAWFLEGRVDGELAAQNERCASLEADVVSVQQECDDKLASMESKVANERAVSERNAMVIADLTAQLQRLYAERPASSSASATTDGLSMYVSATPYKCDSPSAFCSPFTGASKQQQGVPSTSHVSHVHFDAPVSEIKGPAYWLGPQGKRGDTATDDSASADKENMPPAAANTRINDRTATITATGAPKTKREKGVSSSGSPAAISTFHSPSFDHPYRPRLHKYSPSPAKVSPSYKRTRTSAGTPLRDSQMPTGVLTSSTNTLRLNGCVNFRADTARATAKLHATASAAAANDPYRRENDYAVNRSKRGFIISTKSPIDRNPADTLLISTSSQKAQADLSSSSTPLRGEHLRSQSIGVVMSYGKSMKSLEVAASNVYANSVTPPKPPTDSGITTVYRSQYLNSLTT